MNECDVTFEAMGCEVRLIIGAPDARPATPGCGG